MTSCCARVSSPPWPRSPSAHAQLVTTEAPPELEPLALEEFQADGTGDRGSGLGRRRGSGGGGAGHADLPRRQRTRAARGRAGPRQDDPGQRVRGRARALPQPDPVHPGPDARRHHRHHRADGRRSRPTAAGLPPRSGVRQHGARGRDQPSLAPDPERAAGGDAGGHRDDHGDHPSAARSRSACWPPRIPSSSRGPIRCPRPSSTASCSSCASRIPRRTSSPGSSPPPHRPPSSRR